MRMRQPYDRTWPKSSVFAHELHSSQRAHSRCLGVLGGFQRHFGISWPLSEYRVWYCHSNRSLPVARGRSCAGFWPWLFAKPLRHFALCHSLVPASLSLSLFLNPTWTIIDSRASGRKELERGRFVRGGSTPFLWISSFHSIRVCPRHFSETGKKKKKKTEYLW